MKAPVVLERGDATSKKLREALAGRSRSGTPCRFEALPPHDEARRFWSERAWSEYAAVPAMSQTVLALVREGGSMDELASLTLICADEVRHTELSRDLADALGGYVQDIPSGLAYAPQALADPCSAHFAFWVVGNGCISETLSLELMRARLRHTRHPAALEVLQTVAKDEAVHARTAWSLAERLLPKLSEEMREELAEYACELLEVTRQTFVTSRLPPEVRSQARRIREKTAEAGLGACPPDEADAVVERTVEAVILPRLVKLGLTALQA